MACSQTEGMNNNAIAEGSQSTEEESGVSKEGTNTSMYLWAFVWDEEHQLRKKALLLKSHNRWAAYTGQICWKQGGKSHGMSPLLCRNPAEGLWCSIWQKTSQTYRGEILTVMTCERPRHTSKYEKPFMRKMKFNFLLLFPIYFLPSFLTGWCSSSLLASLKAAKYLEPSNFIPKGHAISKGIIVICNLILSFV